MAKIKIEEVTYALDTKFKKVLENTVKKTFPTAEFDNFILLVEFT